jgi:hypothetical protein
VTTRKVRRAVTLSILVAASCNVYNPSLLVGHGGAGAGATGGAGGTTGGSGAGAEVGGTTNAGNGTGGGGGKGSGGTAGRASGGTAGSSGGSGNESTAGGEGGEAGAMTGEGGSVSAGTGGTGGTAGGVSGGAGSGGTAGTGASAGTGGSAAGMGGSAGTANVAGMGGSAGTSAGTAGMGGAVGGAGMGGAGGAAPASGCANLTVPLAAGADKAHFVITLTNPVNMSAAAATISMRVYVLAGSGGILLNYVQDTNFHFLPSTTTHPAISTLVGAWTTVTWNVGSEPVGSSTIDKTNIKRIGIEVNANGTATSGLTNPTKIYVDSISASAITTPTPSFGFDTSGTVATNASNGIDVGGQVLWLNSYSQDTTAANVTLGWLTSCP